MSSLQSLALKAPFVVLFFAALVFPVLFVISAPYGRHARAGFGPSMPAKLGWLIMESPSFFLFGSLWLLNPAFGSPLVTALGAAWLLHYGQRTFVFSLLMRDENRQQPVMTVVMAIAFNVLNASGNAVSLTARPLDLPFWLGLGLFALGFTINLHADHVLRTLRQPGETGYKVPHGGLYGWISSPNYFGELVEWTGFAVAAQTTASWAFVAFAFANLAPRAVANHRWYLQKFPGYPARRRALIPFVW